MSKTNRIYKIFMTSMIVIIAGMLLASGIIALQKSMKLNLSFNMNPNIFCRIDASIGDNTSYNTIFCNTPENATIGAGWSGNGNTLTFTNSSADMVKTVYLKIWNHTETRVMIETTNHTSVISAGTLATGTQGSEFSVSVPANCNASLDFSQVFAVDVSGVSHATVTPESNVYTIDGTYYVKSGATPTFAIESSEHYDELDDVTVSSTAEKSFSNGVFTLSNITGDVTVTASADPSSYTITYDTDGGSAVSAQNYTYKADITLAAAPTKASYDFNGWKVSATVGSWNAGATYTAGQTITDDMHGNVTLVAQWKLQTYTLTLSVAWDAPNNYYDDVLVFVTNDDSFYMNDEGYGNDHDHYCREYRYLSDDIEYFQKNGYEYKIYEDISQSMTIPVGYYVWVCDSGYEVTHDNIWVFYETTITGYNYVQYVIKGLPYGMFRMPSNALNLTLQMYMVTNYNGETWG